MEDQIIKLLNNEINSVELTSNSTDETEYIASFIAKNSKKDSIFALNGELGSGKTLFTKGFLTYFGIENEICSPTFTIVNEYSNNIYHFDVYRLKDEYEFLNSIGEEYFSKGICIIEWADIIKNILPKRTIFIDIKKDDKSLNKRLIKIWRK